MVPFLLRRFLKPVPPAVATLASSQLLRASAQATYQPHTPMIGQLHCLATFHNRPSLAARAAEFPDVIRQWHPYTNIVVPNDVTPFSYKKFWFKCDEGHEWEATLSNRCSKGYGCPICNTFKVTSTKNLLLKYPAVAAEWHLTKNGNLTPENVTSGSSKRVWWQCKKAMNGKHGPITEQPTIQAADFVRLKGEQVCKGVYSHFLLHTRNLPSSGTPLRMVH
eukprot:Colp12_sorted_trinity150504_noHs@22769